MAESKKPSWGSLEGRYGGEPRPRKLLALGTDGFGRSDGREALRDFFEVDARHIALATLACLAWDKTLPAAMVGKAMKDLDIDPERVSPMQR